MLLVVEDIHWADAWTLDQLGALAAQAAKQPLLLIMTTRFVGDPSIGDWRSALDQAMSRASRALVRLLHRGHVHERPRPRALTFDH